MAGRVRGSRRPLNLPRLRLWAWRLFWVVAGVALAAWAIGVHRPW